MKIRSTCLKSNHVWRQTLLSFRFASDRFDGFNYCSLGLMKDNEEELSVVRSQAVPSRIVFGLESHLLGDLLFTFGLTLSSSLKGRWLGFIILMKASEIKMPDDRISIAVEIDMLSRL